MQEICLFPLIYLFNQSFTLVWPHGYLFYIWGCNQILLCLVYMVPTLYMGKVFLQLAPVSTCFTHHCVPHPSTFLLPSILRFSRLILYIGLLPAPVLKSVVSPRIPGSFYCRMVLDTYIRVLGVPVAAGVSMILASQQLNKEIICCRPTGVYTHIYKYFCMQPSVCILS